MKYFSSIKQLLENYLTRVGRSRANQILAGYSDRQLLDIGISRELLKSGSNGWPWRFSDETSAQSLATPAAADIRKAIADLSAYNDAELSDLGLSRGGIVHAVQFGRYGIDQTDERQAA